MLLFEMVTDVPTADDIRKSEDYMRYVENRKLKSEAAESAKAMGIDVDAINKMIEAGEFNG